MYPSRYDIKPYQDHGYSPAISIYLISEDEGEMQKLSCLWCKRTIADIKGHVDVVIGTPVPVKDFGIAINIRCKLCHQNYRLILPSTYVKVQTLAQHIQG